MWQSANSSLSDWVAYHRRRINYVRSWDPPQWKQGNTCAWSHKETALTELGGFFVPFLEWFNDISTSTSCFRVAAFKYSSGFDFQYQIQPLRKQWRRYLIRNFFGCRPFVELIRKGKAEQLLTKISSVNEERDSRSLKQQSPFLNAILISSINLLCHEYLLNKIEFLSLVVDYFRSHLLTHLPH